jgi:hypothetical protein
LLDEIDPEIGAHTAPGWQWVTLEATGSYEVTSFLESHADAGAFVQVVGPDGLDYAEALLVDAGGASASVHPPRLSRKVSANDGAIGIRSTITVACDTTCGALPQTHSLVMTAGGDGEVVWNLAVSGDVRVVAASSGFGAFYFTGEQFEDMLHVKAAAFGTAVAIRPDSALLIEHTGRLIGMYARAPTVGPIEMTLQSAAGAVQECPCTLSLVGLNEGPTWLRLSESTVSAGLGDSVFFVGAALPVN